LNVKQGHCARYAAALALMLRSVGVPTRVVKGYRGAEKQSDGKYVVRFNQAHSWVEALVQGDRRRLGAPDEPDEGLPGDWRGCTLDPTPPLPPTEVEAFSWARWLTETWRNGLALWKDFILEYSPDQQGNSAAQLWARLTAQGNWRSVGSILGVAVLGVATTLTVLAMGKVTQRLWARGGPRPAGRPTLAKGCYARFLTLLARHRRLKPPPAPTPTEFALEASRYLAQRPATADLERLPVRVVDAHYRTRFGGKNLTEAERRAVEGDLEKLETSLKQSA